MKDVIIEGNKIEDEVDYRLLQNVAHTEEKLFHLDMLKSGLGNDH